jgi:hypothetical protein
MPVDATKAYGEIKSSLFTGLEWPRGLQEVKVTRFHETAQDGGKVVSLKHQPHLPQ